MKPIVVCIVGPSGCGKTYMSKFLNERFGIPYVVSMTTRPMRLGEVDGVDHKFVSPTRVQSEKNKHNILAYTQFGGYEYCALHSDVNNRQICSYVIDEWGLERMTIEFSHLYTIIAIYIERSVENRRKDGITLERISRDKKRYKLPPEYYDVIINNNGTLQEFEENIIKAMSNTNRYYEIDEQFKKQEVDIHSLRTRHRNRRFKGK